jgi:hypothetical protein
MPEKSKRKPNQDLQLTDLAQRADTIKRASDDLIRQMKELAGQIQDAKDRAARKPDQRG